MHDGPWFISYAWKGRVGDWKYENQMIEEAPWEWVVKVSKDSPEFTYKILSAIPISREIFDRYSEESGTHDID